MSMERVRRKTDVADRRSAGRGRSAPTLLEAIQPQNEGLRKAIGKEDALSILVVDSCSLGVIGIAVILKSQWKNAKVQHSQFAHEAESLLTEHDWDLVLVEMDLADRSGLDLIEWARTAVPGLRMLAMSSGDEAALGLQALRTGSAGYLNRNGSEGDLLKAVDQVLAGRHFISRRLVDTLARRIDAPKPHSGDAVTVLSARESEIFHALAEGEGIKQIGKRLKISPKTVSTYRRRILEKMHLRNDADIVKYRWGRDRVALSP